MNAPLVQAISNPLEVANNKYGIHIIDANDISKAAELVNSSGGEWGYVTMVIPQTERNHDKWQEVFNQLRRKKLIPLVRLATQVDNGVWRKPTPEDIERWVDFLNSLNWPMSNRYVIIFNEPNHAKEWGGEINPEEYAQVLRKFADELHGKSENFFVLPAGLDASAASDGASLDSFIFLQRMDIADSGIWEKIDGWNSHSYPNPAFSGSPQGWGKGSIRSFIAELEFLKLIGLNKRLPVFISETGWQHNQGLNYDGRLLPVETLAKYLTIAANEVWNDDRVVAVTPFLLNYQDYPFDHFSWVEINNPSQWYVHALTYQGIPKTSGKPKQKIAGSLSNKFFPIELVGQSVYTLDGELVNSGEYIFDAGAGDKLTFTSENPQLSGFFVPLGVIEPGRGGPVKLMLKTPGVEGEYELDMKLNTAAGELTILESTVKIIPPPALDLNIKLGWQRTSQAEEVNVLIYDQQEQLIYKKSDFVVNDGLVKVEGLYGIVPGVDCRVVVIVPGYLPRQEIVKLDPKLTKISFKRFYPLDADLDGAFTKNDIYIILRTSPAVIWQRFSGR